MDDEFGINEPYLNPEPDFASMLARFEVKYYKFDAEGNPYRVYPPDMKPSRTKAKAKPEPE